MLDHVHVLYVIRLESLQLNKQLHIVTTSYVKFHSITIDESHKSE